MRCGRAELIVLAALTCYSLETGHITSWGLAPWPVRPSPAQLTCSCLLTAPCSWLLLTLAVPTTCSPSVSCQCRYLLHLFILFIYLFILFVFIFPISLFIHLYRSPILFLMQLFLCIRSSSILYVIQKTVWTPFFWEPSILPTHLPFPYIRARAVRQVQECCTSSSVPRRNLPPSTPTPWQSPPWICLPSGTLPLFVLFALCCSLFCACFAIITEAIRKPSIFLCFHEIYSLCHSSKTLLLLRLVYVLAHCVTYYATY